MFKRVGRFISLTDSINDTVFINISTIVYFEHDDELITISTDSYEWNIKYTPQDFNLLVNILCF